MSDEDSTDLIHLEPKESDSYGDLKAAARKSRRVAWLLDECIRIPFTQRRVGLDPIIGLIPFGGEAIATLIGATVLGESVKRGIPFKTLIKMGGNMMLNAVLGMIPAAGDLFSVWFKSNSRNYKMLDQFLESDDSKQAEGGWWPITIVFLFIGTILAINLTGLLLCLSVINKAIEYLWAA